MHAGLACSFNCEYFLEFSLHAMHEIIIVLFILSQTYHYVIIVYTVKKKIFRDCHYKYVVKPRVLTTFGSLHRFSLHKNWVTFTTNYCEVHYKIV